MKVSKPFSPVTITLESDVEYEILQNALYDLLSKDNFYIRKEKFKFIAELLNKLRKALVIAEVG